MKTLQLVPPNPRQQRQGDKSFAGTKSAITLSAKDESGRVLWWVRLSAPDLPPCGTGFPRNREDLESSEYRKFVSWKIMKAKYTVRGWRQKTGTRWEDNDLRLGAVSDLIINEIVATLIDLPLSELVENDVKRIAKKGGI